MYPSCSPPGKCTRTSVVTRLVLRNCSLPPLRWRLCRKNWQSSNLSWSWPAKKSMTSWSSLRGTLWKWQRRKRYVCCMIKGYVPITCGFPMEMESLISRESSYFSHLRHLLDLKFHRGNHYPCEILGPKEASFKRFKNEHTVNNVTVWLTNSQVIHEVF